MASRIALIDKKSQMERGGKPIKMRAKIERMLPMMTCHPIARYFSRDCFSNRFHKACKAAEVSNRAMARVGMAYICIINCPALLDWGINRFVKIQMDQAPMMNQSCVCLICPPDICIPSIIITFKILLVCEKLGILQHRIIEVAQ